MYHPAFWMLFFIEVYKEVRSCGSASSNMAAIFEPVTKTLGQQWECRDCHQPVAEDQTVAYHLIDKVLYGWCEACFQNRPVTDYGLKVA